MICHLWRPVERIPFRRTLGLPLYLTLSACGGGGGNSFVANIPAPPIASTTTTTSTGTLPTGTVAVSPTTTVPPASGSEIVVQESWLDSPVTRAGTSALIGRLTVDPGTGHDADWTARPAAVDEFTMTVANAASGGFSYKLNAPTGLLPGGLASLEVHSPSVSWDINSPPFDSYRYLNPYGDYVQILGQRLIASTETANGTRTPFLTNDFTRGTAGSGPLTGANTQLQATLTYDIGYSYVSMGEWSWPVLLNGNPTNATNFGQLLFATGDRTPGAGIPTSGTATYDARTLVMLSSSGTPGVPFTLTADFGLRSIATRIDQDFMNFGSSSDPDPIQGIHVGGSAPFSSDGSFNIPLTGTVNYSYQNQLTPPPSQAATGAMNGAFFGPHAEQVGGTFSLQRSGIDQLPLYQDAFVGQQRRP
jgi:hypothetical protein